MPMKWIVAYVSTAVVFAALDFVWLSLASSRLYKPEIGALLSDKVAMGPAVAFYLLYMIGVVVFAVMPALRSGSLTTAIAYGALFGLIAYATYDLTNMATLKLWSMKVTIADMIWGAFATAVAAAAGAWITRAIVKI